MCFVERFVVETLTKNSRVQRTFYQLCLAPALICHANFRRCKNKDSVENWNEYFLPTK